MPELPEVETTARGIRPYVIDKPVFDVVVREYRLRWPVPENLRELLATHCFKKLVRRGKYLLLSTNTGTSIIHLGMSGSLRIESVKTAPSKHDHIDIVFDDDQCLRFRDPRRFGCLLWTSLDPDRHKLIKSLGPEPLSDAFCGKYLYKVAKNRRVPIKSLLMNSKLVAGIGNIYANEALFKARIDPRRQAGKISRDRLDILSDSVKRVLKDAIDQGGTSLRDFVNAHGNPGYFQQTLDVYNRNGEKCIHCGNPVLITTIAQRSTFFCRCCQR